MPGCTDLISEMKQSDFEAIIAGKQTIPTRLLFYFCSVLKHEWGNCQLFGRKQENKIVICLFTPKLKRK